MAKVGQDDAARDALVRYEIAQARFAEASERFFKRFTREDVSKKSFASAWSKIEKLLAERDEAKKRLEQAIPVTLPLIDIDVAHSVWTVQNPLAARVVRGRDGKLKLGRLAGMRTPKVFELDRSATEALTLPGIGKLGAGGDEDDTFATGPRIK